MFTQKEKKLSDNKSLILDDQIRAVQVRLIDSDGSQVGIVDTSEAQRRASVQNLNLVIVSEDANPPVAKILDFGKSQYDAKKKKKAAKANQTVVITKEIQLRPVTDVGDLDRKIRDAKKFLGRGNLVRFSMRFRGREVSHHTIGMTMMEQIIQDLGKEVTIVKSPVLNGNQILMVVSS